MWAKKLKNNQGETIIWSTNPIFYTLLKSSLIKSFMKNTVKLNIFKSFQYLKLKKIKMPLLVGVTQESFNELLVYQSTFVFA